MREGGHGRCPPVRELRVSMAAMQAGHPTARSSTFSLQPLASSCTALGSYLSYGWTGPCPLGSDGSLYGGGTCPSSYPAWCSGHPHCGSRDLSSPVPSHCASGRTPSCLDVSCWPEDSSALNELMAPSINSATQGCSPGSLPPRMLPIPMLCCP